MNYKKITWQGYYNKKLWSRGAPRDVKRHYNKVYRNYLQRELQERIDQN